MKPLSAISIPDTPDQPWRSLHIFNIYRLTIAGIIITIFLLAEANTVTFGQSHPMLFSFTAICWLIVALASGFASRLRWKSFHWQAAIAILMDISLITLLIYSSDGIQSGLGTLLLVTTAASGILMSGRMAFAVAAIATLMMLLIYGYSILAGLSSSINGYTRVGLLGIGLFAVAIIIRALTLRVRESEALALQRGKELRDLALINDLVIQQMQIGILVVSASHEVIMLNDASRRMFDFRENTKKRSLELISPALAQRFEQWKKSPGSVSVSFTIAATGSDLTPRFTRIGENPSLTTAIFLEDSAQLKRHAQQVKLAALGRLTASIAHEIRNPLSAISHAGQLLAESGGIDTQDRRLTEIISAQSDRLNMIIESIFSLSRKKNFAPEPINIGEWLQDFLGKPANELQFTDVDIQTDIDSHDLTVQFDPTHLDQILSNLCDNVVQHSPADDEDKLRMHINCKPGNSGGFAEINIIDTGKGISKENLDKLFEPFFTTESKGTGLGLFIARELSELNNAHLNYIHKPGPGAYFRLSMPLAAS